MGVDVNNPTKITELVTEARDLVIKLNAINTKLAASGLRIEVSTIDYQVMEMEFPAPIVTFNVFQKV